MRQSMIELLYVSGIYDRINLTKVNYPEVSIETLTVNDFLNELNTIDKIKFLLEEYFLLHYLVFIRGCECSPMLGNFRNYLAVLINRIDSNSAANKTNFEVIRQGQELLKAVQTKKSIIDWTEYDLKKLDDILGFMHDDESTVYVRMVSQETILPLVSYVSRKQETQSAIIPAACLIPCSLYQDHKLTIESYNKVDVHKSLSIAFNYSSNIQSYDPVLSAKFDYYDVLNSVIQKGQTLPIINTKDKDLIEPIKFFVGFKLSIVQDAYQFPEINSALNSSIEPYLQSSWVDYINLYSQHQAKTITKDLQQDNREFQYDYTLQNKSEVYLTLILASIIYRSQLQSGITIDQVSFLHSLGTYLNLIETPISNESLTLSSDQYALIEESPLKRLLHSMGLKYGFLDEEEEYTSPFSDDNQSDPEYTISEQPVTPLEDTSIQEDIDNENNESPDQNDIVDPTDNSKDETDEDTDTVMVDDVSANVELENQDEDTGPLFEFIKDKCTLNELFYKRKIANVIYKILETNPKGLVKEQIKSLEYWYHKLLFLVDIASTKKFLKSVLKDYKLKSNQ